MNHLTLVEPGPEHYAFALSLYLESMGPYTAELMVWDEARQRAGFAQQWRPRDVRIIMLEGREVGWLQVSETEAELHLQQLFVAPPYQRRGIGGEVLRRLLHERRGAGKSVVLTVLKNNPARRLYERVGFTVVGETNVKLEMRREL
jgi:ribosomal protein S18 acetylase RimI-like enzyme